MSPTLALILYIPSLPFYLYIKLMALTRYWPVVRLTMAYKLLFIFLISHVALAWNTDSDEDSGNTVNRLYRVAGGDDNFRSSEPEGAQNYGGRSLMGPDESPLRWGTYGPSYNYFTASEISPINGYDPLVATTLHQIFGPLHPPSYNPTSLQNPYGTPGQGNLYNPYLTGTTYPLTGAGHIYNPLGQYPLPSPTYGSGIQGTMLQPPAMYSTPGYGQTYLPPAPSPYQTMAQPYSPPAPVYNPSGQGPPVTNPKGGAYSYSYAWFRMLSLLNQALAEANSIQLPSNNLAPLSPNAKYAAAGGYGWYWRRLMSLLNQQPQAFAEAGTNQLPSNLDNFPMSLYNPLGQSGPSPNSKYGGAGAWGWAWKNMIPPSILNDLLSQQAMAGASANQSPSNGNSFQSTGMMNKQMGPTPRYTETGTDNPCVEPVTPGPTSQDVKQMGNLMKLVRVLLRESHRGNKELSNSDDPLSNEEGCNLRSGAIESGDGPTSQEIPQVRKKPMRRASPFLRER